MAISHVANENQGANLSTTLSVAYTTNPTAGNFLIAAGRINSITRTLTIDETSGSDTWVAATGSPFVGTSDTTYIWYVLSAGGGATTARITASSTGNVGLALAIGEFSFTGGDASPVFDQHHELGSAAGTTIDSGSTPTTQTANELLIGVGSIPTADTWGAGTNFTIMEPPSGTSRLGLEYRIVSATGAYNATFAAFGSAYANNGMIATFGHISTGSPFVAPDLPNPLIRGPLVDLKTLAQSSAFGMLRDQFYGAQGQPPPNYDWPNPRGALYPSDLRTFLTSTNQMLAIDTMFGGPGQPLFNYDWPLVRRVPTPSDLAMMLASPMGLINPQDVLMAQILL